MKTRKLFTLARAHTVPRIPNPGRSLSSCGQGKINSYCRIKPNHTVPKIRNKYSQKRNCAASFPISIVQSCICERFIFFHNLFAYFAVLRLRTDRGNILIAHRYMNVEIGNEAAQFQYYFSKAQNFQFVKTMLFCYQLELYRTVWRNICAHVDGL